MFVTSLVVDGRVVLSLDVIMEDFELAKLAVNGWVLVRSWGWSQVLLTANVPIFLL